MRSGEVKKLLTKFNLSFEDFEKKHLPYCESKIDAFYKESEVHKYVVDELLLLKEADLTKSKYFFISYSHIPYQLKGVPNVNRIVCFKSITIQTEGFINLKQVYNIIQNDYHHQDVTIINILEISKDDYFQMIKS
ncbi:MAG: hypothetical protein MUC49_02215 [Raineya sp.]|jgi:hypothetical protein|nr:hypothetical protein [Raineya sp.]